MSPPEEDLMAKDQYDEMDDPQLRQTATQRGVQVEDGADVDTLREALRDRDRREGPVNG